MKKVSGFHLAHLSGQDGDGFFGYNILK